MSPYLLPLSLLHELQQTGKKVLLGSLLFACFCWEPNRVCTVLCIVSLSTYPRNTTLAFLPSLSQSCFLISLSLPLFCTDNTVLILLLDSSTALAIWRNLSVSFSIIPYMLESFALYVFLSLIKWSFMSPEVHVDARLCDCEAGIYCLLWFLVSEKTVTFLLGSQYIKYLY